MNLLTDRQKKEVLREYRLRLAAVALFLLSFLLASFALLLVPVAVYVGTIKESLEQDLARLEQRLEATGANRAEAFLQEINTTAQDASGYLTATSFGDIVARLESARAPQIAIKGLSLKEENADEAQVRAQLEGVAATRADLVAYLDALRALPGAAAVDIPLESFAKSAAVPFSAVVLFAPPAREKESS